MSDLSGMDAFEHVVSVLVDQAKDRVRDNDKRNQAEAERNDAIRKLASIEAELRSAKTDVANYRGADDAFIEFYDEVEKAAKILDASPVTSELGGALRTKMGACKKFIDPIPF